MTELNGAFNEELFTELIEAANKHADGSEEENVEVLTGHLEERLVDWFKSDMPDCREFIDSLLDMEDVDPAHVQQLIGTAAADQMLAVAMTLYIESMIT